MACGRLQEYEERGYLKRDETHYLVALYPPLLFLGTFTVGIVVESADDPFK